MADCANKQSLQASLFSLSFCLFFLLPFHFDPIFFPLSYRTLCALFHHISTCRYSSRYQLSPLIESPPAHRIHLSACDWLLSFFFLFLFLSVFLSLRPSLSDWHSPTIHKAYLMLARALLYGLFVQLPWECQTLEGGRKAGGLWALCEKDCDRGSLAVNRTSKFSCHPLCL